MNELCLKVKQSLQSNGLNPDRVGLTADNSVLFSFFNPKRCVDVYPGGEIVVMVRDGDIQNIFELAEEDLPMVIDLIRDGIKQPAT
jgi:hypothetical protein